MEEKSELSDVKPPPAAEEAVVGQNKANTTAEEAEEKKPSSSPDPPNNTTGVRKMLSALNLTGLAPAQLTIFYAGSVSVFDAITAEKVRELMHIAASAAAEKSTDAKTSGTNGPPSPIICTGSSSLQNSSTAPGSPMVQPIPDQENSICKLQAEFPIARRHSLQRFLEKRRGRLVSKNPYPTSPAAPMDNDDTITNIDNKASPRLGCFKQSAMVQEEIQPSPTAYPA